MCKYKDFFVDHMMVVELGLLPPEEDGSDKALVKGMVTFGSFVVFGTVPLLSFLLVRLGLVSASSTFRISCCAAAACMFGMGMLKGQLARQPMLRSGVFMLLNGTVASTAAYITGWAMEECLRGWGVDSGGTPLPGGAGEL
jgi:VIT1/CCC1 family predicted Fe2+/Mn2+ transporter